MGRQTRISNERIEVTKTNKKNKNSVQANSEQIERNALEEMDGWYGGGHDSYGKKRREKNKLYEMTGGKSSRRLRRIKGYNGKMKK